MKPPAPVTSKRFALYIFNFPFPLSDVKMLRGRIVLHAHASPEGNAKSLLTRSREAHNLWTIVASGIVRHRNRALYGSGDGGGKCHCEGTRSRGLAGRGRDGSPTRTAGGK